MPLITRNSQNANVKLGTTAQLAAITFTDGDLASDTTLNKVKVFNGVSLAEIGTSSFSSSAVVSQSTTIANYTTPTAVVANSPSATVEYLIIGGGGGAGSSNGTVSSGGGGGAGGYITAAGHTVTAQSYSITVGAGGLFQTTNFGYQGGSSSFDGITRIGGGGGGSSGSPQPYSDGASGGGAGTNTSNSGIGSQGFNGGTSENSNYGISGGGGSSSIVGGNASISLSKSGDGGVGTASSITGTSIFRAAGGGGGSNTRNSSYVLISPVPTKGFGGNGGGGNGDGTAGTANTGSGGGGNGDGGNGGSGGSGVVIIRYLATSLTATGGTITTDGLYKVHVFNSSSSFVISSIDAQVASNAIDNNTATRWTTDSVTNPNIYVDMGSALNLCAAAFYFDSTNTTNTEILIQSSADASTWTTKRTITTSNLTNGAYNYYRFNIAGGSRYIRFYGNSAGSTVLSIWEIKILKKTDAEIFNDLGILTITASDTTLGADGT